MEKNKFFTHPLVITLCALLCCALWGSATPFIKIGYALIMPHGGVPSTLVFAGIRFFGAGLLTVLIYSVGRRRVLYPRKENLGRVGIIACFQTVIQYLFFYIGLANTSGVKGTILSGSSTFFAILVSCLIFRMEKLNLKKIVACLLGFTGIILVNINGLTFEMNLLGDTFVLFSAISLAISSVLMKRFSRFEDPVVLSGYQFILGGDGGRLYPRRTHRLPLVQERARDAVSFSALGGGLRAVGHASQVQSGLEGDHLLLLHPHYGCYPFDASSGGGKPRDLADPASDAALHQRRHLPLELREEGKQPIKSEPPVGELR